MQPRTALGLLHALSVLDYSRHNEHRYRRTPLWLGLAHPRRQRSVYMAALLDWPHSLCSSCVHNDGGEHQTRSSADAVRAEEESRSCSATTLQPSRLLLWFLALSLWHSGLISTVLGTCCCDLFHDSPFKTSPSFSIPLFKRAE